MENELLYAREVVSSGDSEGDTITVSGSLRAKFTEAKSSPGPVKGSPMRCANPNCDQTASDVTSGSLRLLELEVPPEQRVVRSDGGFPICCVPSRYFWLCDGCSRFLRIRRWTKDGLVLECRVDQDEKNRRVQETKRPVARATLRGRLLTGGAA